VPGKEFAHLTPAQGHDVESGPSGPVTRRSEPG
jgi:hypothetical protein